MIYELKRDTYRKARGGQACFYTLFCANCGQKIMLYQKDMPRGILKRIYLDRIAAPEHLSKLQYRAMKNMPLLQCARCGHVIGVPYVYPKEKRKAYLLEIGSIKKKLSAGKF